MSTVPTQISSGKFIVIEGVDGAGTTTQTSRLVEALAASGRPAYATREPSDGPIGAELRAILRGAHAPVDKAAIGLLFAADRLDHLAREIRPRLAEGIHVVSDRYVMSSLAYQTVDVPRADVLAWNARAMPADLTLFIEVPAAVAAERRRLRGGPEELFDALSFQEQVASAYRREADRAVAEGERVVVIDGSPSADAVFAALWTEMERVLS